MTFKEKSAEVSGNEISPDALLSDSKPSEVEDVLKKGLATPTTVIMEFVTDREENVYPMVPAGKAITEMLLV